MSLTVARKTTRFALSAVIASITAIAAMPGSANAFGPAGFGRGAGENVVRILEQERALAPFASVVFCMKQPDQCRDTGGQAVVALSTERRAELIAVNSSVNRSIRPVNDRRGTDDWEVDVKKGDCEDYALTKRKKLIEMGWSSRSLRIAVALTGRGEGHAVLIAKTSEGDLVLDNRTSAIKDWRRTDLQLVMLQSKDNPQQWYNVGSGRDQLVASAKDEAPATAEVKPMGETLRQASDIGFYP